MGGREERRRRSEDIHRFATRLKRSRVRGLLTRVIDRVPLHAIALSQFYILEAMGGPNVVCVRGAGEVRPGTPADIPGMEKLEGKPAWKFAQRFDRGDRCLVATSGGAVVAYEWFSEQRPFVEELTTYPIRVPADAMFAYDGYIHREFRSRGTFIRLQAGSVDLMRSCHAQRMMTSVYVGNESSLSAHLRLGFRPLYSVQTLTVLGHRYFAERDLPG